MNREEVLAGWLSLLQLILSKNRHHLQKIDIHLFGIGKFEETLIAKFDQLAELRNGIRHSVQSTRDIICMAYGNGV
jgi:hypothetical protein